jgi:hypothetical protein
MLFLRRAKVENEHGSDKSTHSGEVISTETFCQITNRQRSQLKLVVSDDGLLFQGSGRLPGGFLLGASSVSLAKLLDVENHKYLSRKMRLLLSYFLAKAVWQFYNSEWMQREWTKETVHFMFERRSKTPKGIFINEPFLSACFDSCDRPRGAEDGYRSHLFPKILALGIMLLEIELGIKIEEKIEEHRILEDIGPDVEPSLNDDHIAAIEVFNNTKLWDDKDTFPRFKSAIGACLTPDNFKPFVKDVQGLRNAFEKHIVNPIQALYNDTWGNPDTAPVRAINLDSSNPALPEANEGTARLMSLSPSPTPLPAPVATPAYQIQHYSLGTHFAARVQSPSFCYSMQ